MNMTVREKIDKIKRLKHGEKFLYHTGFICRDAIKDEEVREMRDTVKDLIEVGEVAVVHKKIGTAYHSIEKKTFGVYEYTVIKGFFPEWRNQVSDTKALKFK